jgi:hypothetical protein
MADRSNDALAYWQTMMLEMQKGFNAFANQAMASSQFSRMMTPPGAGTDAGAGAQKQFGALMEKYLVSMPSQTQMADVAERLQAIEAQLIEIKGLLQPAQTNPSPPQGASSAPVRPPRAKRTPGSPAEERK